ncbi:hypothetical protein H9Y04_31035 [Streptomyces sp. TRM66268-LWL]|uniref:Lipoprotein n=1 Tax=Streptomyces polyasparticus TaxID=2767826 RepID=A0ABR7SRN6_9ACTN|nr:hypothetical protein [Streptomyces polyasparticus]MBC9716978.1 hypothetical protein [Streptomyces polyasparticus]
MRRARFARVMCAPVLVGVLALMGCQKSPGASGSLNDTSASKSPSGYGLVFLGVDECASRGRGSTEVPCTSEKAQAQVIARYDGRQSEGPACPAYTDFVLHISESRPAYDEDGDGAVPKGYACMRNLESPHPGDPGGGGGPRTIVGDCVYTAGKGEVRETACDGSGENKPEFKVRSAVQNRDKCPKSTELYVQLGGSKPVGCAVPA